jgi:hypothetical protein
MKKAAFLFFICLFIVSAILAQDTIPEETVKPKPEKKQKKSFGEKVYFGGGIGLSFGSYTRIAVYPMMGYKFTPKLSGGIELGYEYISDNRYSSKYNTSNYGASVFTRYRLIPQIFLHAEYAMYNYELYYSDKTSNREWVPFLFLGAGFAQQIAPGTWAYASVKFDVIQNKNSPYKEWAPFWNVGVSVGF